MRSYRPYALLMRLVQVFSILALLNTVRAHFVMPLPTGVQFALSVFGVATMLSIVAFCVAMRWFCEEAGLLRAAKSWSVTTLLFFIIYLIPLGMFHLIAAIAVALGKSFNINLGPAGLLLLLVFVIPIVHLFVSTSRMKRSAESLSTADATDLVSRIRR